MNLDSELTAIDQMIRKVEKGTISNVLRLNKRRAKTFKESAIEDTKWGKLGLKKNQPATVKIQGYTHSPEYFTGEMLNSMDIKEAFDTKIPNGAEVGFFYISNKKPKGNGTATYSDIAMLQTTGFRIPLTGEKGEKVRAFLASKGIFPKKGKQFLIVPPRPFLFKALENFEKKDRDTKVINQYFKELWAGL